MVVPTTSLLEHIADVEGDKGLENNSYGATYADEFLPLGGTKNDPVMIDGRLIGLEDENAPDRPSATLLIYLCALCSSLTSVLLGYGERVKCAEVLGIVASIYSSSNAPRAAFRRRALCPGKA